jgi:valyl-tRNA synthetase
MKEIPFKKVFIHPTVLTKEGKRMSKSLGTGINPISLVEKYGSDATRFGIIWLLSGNQDIKFVEDHLIMGRKFCNKIWNAGRFVIFQIKNPLVIPKNIENIKLKSYEKETIEKLKKTVEKVNNKIENFEFGLAAREIYEFFWHQLCYIFIENFKKEKDKNYKLLLFLYLNSLKLLHPFLPFLTEEIYQKLPIKNKKISILFESWPSFK